MSKEEQGIIILRSMADIGLMLFAIYSMLMSAGFIATLVFVVCYSILWYFSEDIIEEMGE